jgi:hypothetical protein
MKGRWSDLVSSYKCYLRDVGIIIERARLMANGPVESSYP